ncbi:MAG: CPBP family intramembrane metalloprotease [Elusimicrobia bacterium]|nr:CPBP family intramembrane metalloprotease [Elusimicrobiota bacterium]
MKLKVKKIVPLKEVWIILFLSVFAASLLVKLLLNFFVPIKYFEIIYFPLIQICMSIGLFYVLRDEYKINFQLCFNAYVENYKENLKLSIRYFFIFITIFISAAVLLWGLYELMGIDSLGYKSGSSTIKNFFIVDGEFYLTGFIILIFSSCIIAPILEELMFRRLLFVALREKFNFVLSLTISSLIFTIFHLSLIPFFYSMYLGWVYEKESKLPVNIMLHSFINLFIIFIKGVIIYS